MCRVPRFQGHGTRRFGVASIYGGLRGLNDKDKSQVSLANKDTRNALKLIDIALCFNIALTVENLSLPTLWLLPSFVKHFNSGRLHKCTLDYCQFGEPFRKRTIVAFSGLWSMDTMVLRCKGRRGVCSQTQARHCILRGKHPSGLNMTKFAEPYPSSLCRRLAGQIMQAYQLSLINKAKQQHTARRVCPRLYLDTAGRGKY